MTVTREEAGPQNSREYSTGPRTPEGKAISRQNARTHGLCSTWVEVLPGEDPEDLAQLRAELFGTCAPAAGLETGLVEKMLLNEWLLRRAQRTEYELFLPSFTPAEPGGAVSATPQADAFTAKTREFSLVLRYVGLYTRGLEKLRKELRGLQTERRAREAQEKESEREKEREKEKEKEKTEETARRAAPEKSGGPLRVAPLPPHSTQDGSPDSMEETDWPAVYQELYFAVSAGPQSPHPLLESYYGAYAIWLKQYLMVELDIGDDEAGSRIAALEITLQMRLENAVPRPGQVWGPAKGLAHWREACVPSRNGAALFEAWCTLVKRDYARRDGTVEEAAARIAALPPDGDLDKVLGPWHSSGDLAQKDAAVALAERLRAAGRATAGVGTR